MIERIRKRRKRVRLYKEDQWMKKRRRRAHKTKDHNRVLVIYYILFSFSLFPYQLNFPSSSQRERETLFVAKALGEMREEDKEIK